ncbi:phage tail length tape measure family protein [Pseudomonas sp. TMP9]|uniref:phage tail length tape measure family protein n=1 Tax=Pseudomonas sp. TMP9 TaxID=3133144 RepID=UPI0030D3A1F5
MAFDRLIQLTLRARNFLSGDVQPATDSMRELAEEGQRLKASMEDVGRARGFARSLRDSQQATEGLSRAQADARATLDDLTRELGDNAEATAGQRIAMREARRTLDEAERAYKKNQSAIKNLTTDLKQMGVDTDNVTAEEKRLAAELEDGKKALGDNRDAIKQKRVEEKKAADTTKEHADRVDAARGFMANGAKQVLAFAAAYVSLSAVMGLVQGGLRLVAQGIRAVALDGSEKQQALGQLEAALASTGRQAEFTAKQLLDMADAAEASSMLTAEQVQSAQARLLSYTDVAATEFPRAMQIIIDQQQRLGISVEQSAEIVGRALQSPSEAITTLGRQGFKLEDGQKRLLRQLEATGKTAEAQAIIMDMLSEAYGGSAAAARLNTAAGLWKGLGDRVGDFASRVANSGAFDFIQRKLVELSDYLDEMANDGRLDKLAEALSNAFIQGAEKVEEFALKLLDVDFKTLTDDSAAWLNQFGRNIDKTVSALQMMTAPIRIASNVLTGFMAAAGTAFTALAGTALSVMATVAKAVPDALGGKVLVAGIESALDKVFALMEGLAGQVAQDGRDITDTFSGIGSSGERAAEKIDKSWKKIDRSAEVARKKSEELADAVTRANFKITGLGQAMAAIKFADSADELRLIKVALEEAFDKKLIDQSGLETTLAAVAERMKIVEASTRGATAADKEQSVAVAKLKAEQQALLEQRLKDEISLEAYQKRHNELAVEIAQLTQGVGDATLSIKSYQDAQEAFSSAGTVAELEALKKALFNAYNSKAISLEQFQEQHNAASVAIQKLGGASRSMGDDVKGATGELQNLADVQSAIASAKTDVEFNNIRAALRRMLNDGLIGATEYNKALDETNTKQKELKGAVVDTGNAGKDAGEKLTDSQIAYNKALEDGIVTNEELRRISGKRMEEERRASGEAMERSRKDGDDTKRDISAFEDFFGGVISRAREPLAAMSAAALEFYDRLRGISSVDVSVDTGSLDATRDSLERVTKALGDVQAEAAKPMISGLGRWQLETQQASLKTQQAFLGQKAALQNLTETYARGDISAKQFVASASSMRRALSLLDDSDLSGLESAISAAQQRMEQMNQSTRGTLEGLMDELDGLQGRTEEIERRKFASRQRELQTQLAEAQAGGDSQAVANAQRALGMLRQIEAETAQQRQRTEQEKRIEANKPAATAAPATPGKTIRLENANGKSVDVAINSASDETNLLSILEDAGLRAL